MNVKKVESFTGNRQYPDVLIHFLHPFAVLEISVLILVLYIFLTTTRSRLLASESVDGWVVHISISGFWSGARLVFMSLINSGLMKSPTDQILRYLMVSHLAEIYSYVIR